MKMSFLEKSEIGRRGLPTLYDFRPAGAPALQWDLAFCGAGALAGVKTTDHDSQRIGIFTRGSRINWSGRTVIGVLVVVLGFVGVVGCRSTAKAPEEEQAGPWDVARAENSEWRPDDERFSQDFALETSGLAFSGQYLWAPSEKYARLLAMDPGGAFRARVIELEVPRHAELEGLAWHDKRLYLCDEAHAAVYRVDVGNERELLNGTKTKTLVAVELPLVGVEVAAGKIGVEGIEVAPDGSALYLLLERSGDASAGCVSRIWRLHMEKGRLVAEGDPLDIALEDCNWRLTGLAWMGERLLGLKTQYPGERYEIVEIDRTTGAVDVVQDLTDYLRGVRAEGWGNNVEGIAIDDDGALWLISDNAVTGVIDNPYPPRTDERALLVRIPRRSE
jgi:hypothetical protein